MILVCHLILQDHVTEEWSIIIGPVMTSHLPANFDGHRGISSRAVTIAGCQKTM